MTCSGRAKRKRGEGMEKILELLHNVNYYEWQRLKYVVDAYFEKEIGNRKKEIAITDTRELQELYKRLF